MEISLHDNIIYGCLVKCADFSSPVYQLVLFTEYFGADQPVEHVDVVFSGVITHRFESMTSQNVIMDIEETTPQEIYQQDEATFLRLKNYSWPFLYKDRPGLLDALDKKGVRAFRLHSSCGMDGWVLAGKMELIPRVGRKEFS